MSIYYNSSPAYRVNDYWGQPLSNPRQAILPSTTNTEDAKLCAFPHTFALGLERDASKTLAFSNAVNGDGKTPEINLNYQQTPKIAYSLSQQPLNQGEAEYLAGLFRACLGSTIGFYVEEKHLSAHSDLSALWRFESQTISLQVQGYDPKDLSNNFYQISDAKLVSTSNNDIADSFFNPKVVVRPHDRAYKSGSFCQIQQNYNCQDASVIAWSGVFGSTNEEELGVGIILPYPNSDLAQSVEFDRLSIPELRSVNSSIYYNRLVWLACKVNGVCQVYRYDPHQKASARLIKIGNDLDGVPQKLFIWQDGLYLITDTNLYRLIGTTITNIPLPSNFRPLDAIEFSHQKRLFIGGYIANTAALLESSDGSHFNQVPGVPQSFTACAIASLLEIRGDLILLARDIGSNQSGIKLHKLPNGITANITTSSYIEIGYLPSIFLYSISRIDFAFLLGHYYFAVGDDLWLFDGQNTAFHSLESLGMPNAEISCLKAFGDALLINFAVVPNTYLFSYLPQSNDTVMQVNKCLTLLYPTGFISERPFTGGQCPGVLYRVYLKPLYWNGDFVYPGTEGEGEEIYVDVYGPVARIYCLQTAAELPCNPGDTYYFAFLVADATPGPNATNIFLSGGGCTPTGQDYFGFLPGSIRIVRFDGLPDNCDSTDEKRFLTDSDRPIFTSNEKFHVRYGLEVSNLSYSSDLAIDNGEASLNLANFIDDSLLSEDIIRYANRASSATQNLNANAIRFILAVVDRVSYNTTHNWHPNQVLMTGEIGEIKIDHARATLELASLKSKLQNNNALKTTSYCRHVLGDNNCQVNLEPLSTTGQVTILYDRPQFFEAQLAINIPSTDYYLRGRLQWLSGENRGVVSEVAFQDNYSSDTMTLGLWETTPYPIAVGDSFKISPGCDRSIETCHNKFNNVPLFGGFPWIPGSDRYLAGSNLSAPG